LRKLAPHAVAVFLPVLAYLLLRYSGWLGEVPLHVGREAAALVLSLGLAVGLLLRHRTVLKRQEAAAVEAARVHAALRSEVRERASAEQAHDRFFDLSMDMLAIAGTDGYFRELNPAWEKVLGWTLAELMARPYIELIHPDDVEATGREAQKLRLGGNAVDFENRYRAKDGTWRWLSWRSTALPERGLIYAVARDVSDRKKVEQMKTDFISVVSHELRTPLTSIRGSLGLIAGGVVGELPEKAGALVEIAAKNSERLVRLINDILDVEKIESGKMGFRLIQQELMPLVEHAVESSRAYARQFDIEIRIAADVPGVKVRVDTDRIEQVLANLLSNATKFSPRGGTVELRVTREAAAHVRVAVVDHGKGIPPEFQDRVFEKFAQADVSSTRQKGGTGLGLSISQAIVERHGGEMGFITAPGKGTTFFFDLPEWMALAEEVAAAAAGPARSAAARILVCTEGGRARILHVEDDADLQQVVAAIVEKEADIEPALSLGEARQKLARERFDLVILDLALPDGSGLDLVPYAGSLTPPTPVVIFSAHEVDAPIAGRVASVLIKSRTSNRQLLEKIQTVLADGGRLGEYGR
jgi:PAS domain S-box-containing protein